MAILARWLEAPPDGWDALRRADPNATPAHRYDVARALAEALPGCEARFIAVEQDGVVIGGAPLVVERRFGLEWIRAMPFTLPAAPLARPGLHAQVDRLVAETLDAQARNTHVVGGEWVLFRPLGPTVESGAVERLAGETLISDTEVVDLSQGAAEAYRRLNRRERESIATTAARGLFCAEEPEALDETYALYSAQARGWRGHRLKPLALFRRLLLAEPTAARLFTVRDSRGLLAGALALIAEHEWLLWWSGSHPDARRRQGFGSLLWSIAESAARAGASRFNLGASAGHEGVASFKKALGAREFPVPIRWIGADYAGSWGRAVAVLQRRRWAGRWRGAPA